MECTSEVKGGTVRLKSKNQLDVANEKLTLNIKAEIG